MNSVYRVKPYKATFNGCYKVEILSLKQLVLLSKVSPHTVESCADSCGVNSIFGLAEGNTCYCFKAKSLRDVEINTTLERFKLDNGECNVRCHGYHGQVCGGTGGSIAVYRSTG